MRRDETRSMDLVVELLKVMLSKIVSDEFAAECPLLAKWLVKRSAGLLHADRQRFEERWLVDLEDRKTPLRKRFFAGKVFAVALRLRRGPYLVRLAVIQRLQRSLPKRDRVHAWVRRELRRVSTIQNADGSVSWFACTHGFWSGGCVRPFQGEASSD